MFWIPLIVPLHKPVAFIALWHNFSAVPRFFLCPANFCSICPWPSYLNILVNLIIFLLLYCLIVSEAVAYIAYVSFGGSFMFLNIPYFDRVYAVSVLTCGWHKCVTYQYSFFSCKNCACTFVGSCLFLSFIY